MPRSKNCPTCGGSGQILKAPARKQKRDTPIPPQRADYKPRYINDRVPPSQKRPRQTNAAAKFFDGVYDDDDEQDEPRSTKRRPPVEADDYEDSE